MSTLWKRGHKARGYMPDKQGFLLTSNPSDSRISTNSLGNISMRTRFVVLSIIVGLGAVSAAAQQTYRARRLADGHPDLNGIWQAMVTANWDLQDHDAQPGPHPDIMGAYGAGPAGQSIVEGGEIPYQPWALQKKKQNFEKRMMVDVTDDKKWHDLGDPELKCYMPGLPRATYMPFPFQIVQGSGDYI